MIKRNGFVSNSSSTSFIIENKTKERIHLCEFIKENTQLITQFEKEYFPITGERFTHSHTGEEIKIPSLQDVIDRMCKEAGTQVLIPGGNYIEFGDEEGTLLGEIYDYILRDGGESKKFKWSFKEFNR